MKLNDHEKSVLRNIVQRLKAEFGAEQVLLYGSAARGDMDSESDIDLMAIMPRSDWETKKRVCDMCFEAELNIGRIISVRCVSSNANQGGGIVHSPLISNVQREGIRL